MVMRMNHSSFRQTRLVCCTAAWSVHWQPARYEATAETELGRYECTAETELGRYIPVKRALAALRVPGPRIYGLGQMSSPVRRRDRRATRVAARAGATGPPAMTEVSPAANLPPRNQSPVREAERLWRGFP